MTPVRRDRKSVVGEGCEETRTTKPASGQSGNQTQVITPWQYPQEEEAPLPPPVEEPQVEEQL
eukprot:5911351-Prorocentrum_lima.AAC.1